MKKLFVILCLLFLFVVENFAEPLAAFQKGNMVFGGFFRYNTRNTKHIKFNGSYTDIEYDINPQFAYFFYNNFALGIETLYTYTRRNDYDATDMIGIGPSFTYFWGKNNQQLCPFMGIGESIQRANPFDKSDDNYNSFMTTVSIGLLYFVKNDFAVSTKIYYSFGKLIIDSDESNDFTELHNVIGIQIGLSSFLVKN